MQHHKPRVLFKVPLIQNQMHVLLMRMLKYTPNLVKSNIWIKVYWKYTNVFVASTSANKIECLLTKRLYSEIIRNFFGTNNLAENDFLTMILENTEKNGYLFSLFHLNIIFKQFRKHIIIKIKMYIV